MTRDSGGAHSLSDLTLGVPATGPFSFKPHAVYDWAPISVSLEIQREKERIRKLHDIIDAGIEALKAEEFMKFYMEDAQLVTTGAPVAKGPQTIQKFAAKVFSLPNFGLPIRYHDTIVSSAQDLAFTYGEIAM